MHKEAESLTEREEEMENLWGKQIDQLRRRAWGTGLLNSEDEVEEVLQEAAVSILERLDTGEQIRCMDAYAKRTVYRKACDLRRRGRREVFLIEKMPQKADFDPATQELDVDVRAGEFEGRRRRFWTEVAAKLCPADRTVLGLALEGCEPGQIARILRRTPGAVYASRFRINRAMEEVARRQGVSSEEDLFGPALWPKGPTGGGRRRSAAAPRMSDSDGPDVLRSRAAEHEETPGPPEGRNWDD